MGRLARDGSEVYEPDDEQPPLHNPECDGNGWAGYDDDGRIRPCYDCRPHLRREET